MQVLYSRQAASEYLALHYNAWTWYAGKLSIEPSFAYLRGGIEQPLWTREALDRAAVAIAADRAQSAWYQSPTHNHRRELVSA
jgi:hypothetical protein